MGNKKDWEKILWRRFFSLIGLGSQKHITKQSHEAIDKEMLFFKNNFVPKKPSRVTRVEVIDGNGRSYVNWKKENKVELSLQDDGCTLKIFVRERSKSLE